jgi:osmotically inducible protein OsmC
LKAPLVPVQRNSFNQALANNFGMIGFEAEAVQTTVVVELGYGSDTYPSILSVAIGTQVGVLGISKERFDYCAERARTHCTIARLLNIEPTMEAELLNQ